VPISKKELWPAWGSLLLFVASAVTLATTLMARTPALPMHELREYHLFDELHGYHFFDLRVYRRAAEVVGNHRPLYATKLRHGLGFTYPPVAVLMFLSLRWLPIHGDELAVTIINIALVAVVAHTALRLRRPSGAADPMLLHRARLPRSRVAAGWLAAAAILWVEPITTTLGYGQIDLLITALVIVDLVYGSRSRAGGLGIGVAAALKLTPLIFIPYLLLTGRSRMATRALAAFALSVAVAFAAVPGDASTYWLGGKFMDVSRVTGGNRLAGSGAANQSLRGTVLRIFSGTPHLTLIWLLACLIVGSLGLLLAITAARRGDEAWGFMLTALTGLLISPVSWTHHWTIAVAGVIALIGVRGRPVLSWFRAAIAIAFGLVTPAIWLIIALGPGSHPGTSALLLGNLYVIAGMGVIVAAAVLELQHATHRRARAVRRPSFAPLVPAGRTPKLAPTPLIAAAPGHPGDSVRAITTSQALAPDRQSLR
jgi:alpha-1,2-mannosyltransferase